MPHGPSAGCYDGRTKASDEQRVKKVDGMDSTPNKNGGRKPRAGSAADFIALSRTVFPAIFGLGISQAVLAVSVYGNASYANDPLVPNLSTIVVAPFIVILIVVLGRSRRTPSERTMTVLASCGVLLQAVCPFLFAIAAGLALDLGAAKLALSALSVMGNALTITAWLRMLKRLPRRAVALTAFTAAALCELLAGALSLFPYGIACGVACVLALMQIPLALFGSERLRRSGQLKDPAAEEASVTAGNDYLELLEARSNDPRFLTLSVVAAVVMSLAIGLLWGFPNGRPIALSPVGRGSCAAYAVAVSLLVARKLGHPSGADRPAGTWMTMQALGLAALFLDMLVPQVPALGMMFLYAFNAVGSAFIWCIAVALMDRGQHNAYCYGLGGQLAFLLPGALARLIVMVAMSLSPESALAGSHFSGDALMAGALGVLLLLPVQIVMSTTSKVRLSDKEQMGRLLDGLTHAMGLDGEEARPADMRRAFMRNAAIDMQKTFDLSDREADVLALYALGMTQGKIAEELHVSPSTVHTHIMHIYSKTGLHSRQSLIDHMDARHRTP